MESVKLNHTIVWCHDGQRSASFLVQVLGLSNPVPFGPFLVVALSNEVSLDFHQAEGEITSQHYAFLITEDEFDLIFGRICEQGITYWADPDLQEFDEINLADGGRGVYFKDPDGHLLEVITRPYGSG
jgi:catechol 2,3-dioxygenase-like lactoylglutathione lyase family enzyme